MTYKKLFEVRILHDYYLTQSDGTSYYSLNAQKQKDTLLQQLQYNSYKIANDIDIQATASSKQHLKSYHLKYLKTSLGFVVLAEVDEIVLNNNDKIYQPFMAIPSDLTLGFNLFVKNAYLHNFTALSFNSSFPFHYYFSNHNDQNEKNYPALSLPVSPYLSSKTYEMGDLATFGSTQKQAIVQTLDNALLHWKFIDGNGLVHQNDRRLLPKAFTYKFENTAVLSAQFTLKSLEDVVIKTITTPVDNTILLTKVRLNFSNQNATLPETTGTPIPNGWYRLSITTNNGIELTQDVLLHDELYRGRSLGAIEISNAVTDADFRITKENGTLITQTLANGSVVPHPIFEIRLRSRSTYWRYKKETDFDIIDVALTAPFLTAFNNELITKTPMPLSSKLIHFKENNNSIPLRLPNPSVQAILPESDGKIYSNVYISKINLLTTS